MSEIARIGEVKYSLAQNVLRDISDEDAADADDTADEEDSTDTPGLRIL